MFRASSAHPQEELCIKLELIKEFHVMTVGNTESCARFVLSVFKAIKFSTLSFLPLIICFHIILSRSQK